MLSPAGKIVHSSLKNTLMHASFLLGKRQNRRVQGAGFDVLTFIFSVKMSWTSLSPFSTMIFKLVVFIRNMFNKIQWTTLDFLSTQNAIIS